VNAPRITRVTLEDIEEMRLRGQIKHNPDAPERDDMLPEGFWDDAVVVEPKHKSVHLRLDGEVYEHFYTEMNGKGHITRMQQVLAAYVRAQKKRAAKGTP
jgi:uncharacterized protein (DUF4415 family)